MIEGLLAHRSHGKIAATNGSVVWGTSLKSSFIAGFTVENAQDVKVYRCKNCGFLENYAK